MAMCATSSHTQSVRQMLIISGEVVGSDKIKHKYANKRIGQLTHWSVIAGNTCGKEQRQQALTAVGMLPFVSARRHTLEGQEQQHSQPCTLMNRRLGSDRHTAQQPASPDDNNRSRLDEMSMLNYEFDAHRVER